MLNKAYMIPATLTLPTVRRRDLLVAVGVLALAVALVVLVADPAMADPSTTSGGAGAGLGKTFQEWAKWLIPGTAAIVGIPAMSRGDMGTIVPLMIVVMVLGAFAFMTASGFESFAKPIIDSITNGKN
jgi:hypothetical protein